MEWWLEGAIGQLLTYAGLPAAFLLFYLLWKFGDWDFKKSELALVECDEGDVDFTEAPERQLLMNSLFATGILFVVILFAMELQAFLGGGP